MVYAKEPFAGPEAVLAYLSRYTHRVGLHIVQIVRDILTAIVTEDARHGFIEVVSGEDGSA